MDLKFHPLIPDRWVDFETLFGSHGAYGGCWCMFWRLTRREFGAGCKSGNKARMKALVDAGTIPGILAYDGNEPVGWCSVAPREDYGSLERSRTLKRIDNEPVWSIVCFFSRSDLLGKGMMRELIKGAETYAKRQGAKVIEAYPDLPGKKRPAVEMYMGSLNTFLNLGYNEIAVAGTNAIVRKIL
jgi:hypothetical protein